jgi:hypothetical protein
MGWKDAPIVEDTQPSWASAPVVDASATPQGERPYVPFSKVREDIDVKTLNDDQDWIAASRMLYQAFEQKPFEGTDAELVEYGKDVMAYFNYNTVGLARVGNAVVNGTQEEKEAFLWMMDTYDNLNISWEGTGRFATNVATDPLTYVGLGTLGAGFVAKQGAATATKVGIKEALKTSLGRTGITAGVEGAFFAGTDSAARQLIEMDAGRRDEFSFGKFAADTAIGMTAGVVLGTTADAAVSQITRIVSGAKASKAVKAVDDVAPDGTPVARAADGTEAAPVRLPEVEVTPVVRAADEIPTLTRQVGDEAPVGSTLSRSEIDEATARQQKGRLAEDDTAPVSIGTGRDVNIEVPGVNTGLRSTPQTMKELSDLGSQVADQLRVLRDADLEKALETMRTGALPLEQTRIVARGIQMYADELRIQQAELFKQMAKTKDPAKLQEMTMRSYELDNRLASLGRADDAFGSMAGSMLRQRQEGLRGVDGLTVEKIMQEENMSREAAEQAFASRVARAQQGSEVRAIENDYDPQINQALARGDFDTAARLTAEKSRSINALTNEYVPKEMGIIRKATEWAISQVFTAKTIMINLIPSGTKTLLIPMLKAIAKNPFEKATRVELAASYNAMRTTTKSAFKAATEAYKYEQSLLTRDNNKLLEGGMAIGGKFGGAVRFFPRVINATDEFLSQINYASYIAGKAAGEAVVEGSEKGLKGKELDAYIKKAVQRATDESFAGNTGEDIVNPIISKGMKLGYTGDNLFKYVEREISGDAGLLAKLGYEKDLSLFRRGTDAEALAFVRDVLYKRDFSGDGKASKFAQKFDGWFREFPSLKLITGQLFFRTPVRVFEEGVRLTPGLQLIAPGFVKDLAGANGSMRQVRAQSEALMSLGMAGSIMALYAGGRITGDMAYSDYHQQKLRGDGPKQPPYTIKFSDGSTWSYRNFDPVATPMKIIVNALERGRVLELREAQGEFVNASEYQKVMAAVTVAVGAMARAFTDAGLTEGVNQMIKYGEAFADPEGREGQLIRMASEKLNLVVPNTLRKVARENDPTIKDPADFWQAVETSILGPISGAFGGDAKLKTSYSYDVLGNPREMIPGGAVFDLVSTASVEQRQKGRSPTELFVLSELDRISRVTGATFKPPIKHPSLGGLDLRTIMASDGKRTLYDAWQDNYRNLNPSEALYPILAAPLPDGTFKHKGLRVQQVRDVISGLQDAAFKQLMAQEERVLERYIQETINKAQSQAGMFDTPRR